MSHGGGDGLVSSSFTLTDCPVSGLSWQRLVGGAGQRERDTHGVLATTATDTLSSPVSHLSVNTGGETQGPASP